MIGYCQTGTFLGAQVCPIRVEAKTRPGKPSFSIIGLGDSAVRESRDRITSALRVSGFDVPDQILINLAPADVKKEGSGLDLAMALSILIADQQIPELQSTWVFGELSLDGAVKSVRGIAGYASDAALAGVQQIVVPTSNSDEAQLVPELEVIGVSHLKELRDYVLHGVLPEYETNAQSLQSTTLPPDGLESVIGQADAKHALEIAAAGGHNVLMVGPPGCGKSMLAERFRTLLPPLTTIQRLESVRIASIVGKSFTEILRGISPYRAPHHIISGVGMVGGGSDLRPGEISLAHNGVLFLDEFPEFQKLVLEALRAPLEAGKVTITRARGTATYPSRFQLIAAMNPCPCGRFGLEKSECRCTRHEIARYLKRLSEPILERIDLQVQLEPVPYSSLNEGLQNSKNILIEAESKRRDRVFKTRDMQFDRRGKLNALLSHEELKEAGIEEEVQGVLQQISDQLYSSARLFMRVLRVSRTIADLSGNDSIQKEDIMTAMQFRALHKIWRYVEAR